MSDKIHVQRVSPLGTGDWRATRSSGDPLFDIRLQISSRFNGSRYFVISPHGDVVRYGTFHFETWDHSAMKEVLVGIVTKLVPESEVDVELDPPQQASGTQRI